MVVEHREDGARLWWPLPVWPVWPVLLPAF